MEIHVYLLRSSIVRELRGPAGGRPRRTPFQTVANYCQLSWLMRRFARSISIFSTHATDGAVDKQKVRELRREVVHSMLLWGMS